MRLKNRKEAPAGGWYYDCSDGQRISAFHGGNLDKLHDKVLDYLEGKGLAIPENLLEEIEDQICMRQPADRCWYTGGLGDRISKAIHAAAEAVDSVAGTTLAKKARRCNTCGGRRRKLNNIKLSSIV